MYTAAVYNHFCKKCQDLGLITKRVIFIVLFLFFVRAHFVIERLT